MKGPWAWGGVVLALVLSCTRGEPRQPPRLEGTWSFDAARVDELFVVSSAREGASRQRARARALTDMADMTVRFGETDVTLSTARADRTVAYRIVRWQGPFVVLGTEAGGEGVRTHLMVDGDRMTWFDGDGEVEFVFRR